MPDLKITELTALASANLAATDPIAVVSLAGSDTKKITAKDFVQKAVTLIDDASIPSAKVSLSGISGTNLSAGTVAASKLDTSTIPATGGVTVSSSNLQLVAPTSPIVRNAGTGSLEHANSGVTAGTYTKVTVDTRGHVTVGAALVGGDLPIATSSLVGGVSIPAAGGFALTGGGALSHSNSVAGGASTRSGITYDLQGHIVSTAALVAADLPVATNAVKGAVIAGGGLAIDGSGIVSVNVATTTDVGGIKIGSEFGLNGSNQLLLATQASVAGGTAYPKVTVNSKGVVTAGASLTSADIPALDTTKITSGTLGIDRYGANTITGAKLANYATGKISEAFPTADYISQLYFNPLDRTLYMWDGNVYQPIGVSYGQVVFSGTYDAGTNLIASVTTEGAAIGLTVGGALVSPVTATKGHYVVVDQPGTGTAPAPTISLSPPDMLLSNGTTWVLLDVSDTVTAQLASNIQVSPAGNIASTNVQSALQELDDEKLPLAGGTLTGNLALNTGIAIVYEGATTDNFETTLYVVDPTADRTILLPNVSGTVVTTGDTGTVTSTMIVDGTIVDADINASAAIVDTKLATIATAGKVSNSATTAASANTASAIVARDASGNFTAGTITAALTGAASSNVLKAGDTMTGALVVPLASASTPSLTFTGDLNTGIFSPGADQVAVATNGTQRLTVDTAATTSTLPVVHPLGAAATPSITFTGDLNTGIFSPGADQVAISTNGTGRLFVDATGNVGVGTASPGYALDIASADTSAGNALRLRHNATATAAGLQFTDAGATAQHGLITSDSSSNLKFSTGNTEKLRITSAGNVGIGNSGPIEIVDIGTASPQLNTATNIRIMTGNSGGTNIRFFGGGNSSPKEVARIRTYASSYTEEGNIGLFTASNDGANNLTLSQKLTILASGNVGIGTTSPGSPLTIESNAGNQVKVTYPSVASYYLNVTSGGALAINKDGTEYSRWDSSGRLLVGTSTARDNYFSSGSGQSLQFQIEGTDYKNSCASFTSNSTSAGFGPHLAFGRSRGAAVGSNTLVNNGDTLGVVVFHGNDGSKFVQGARIDAEVDGTPGGNDMPGRLVFSTTADGASSPTERMSITSTGQLRLAGAGITFNGDTAAANELDDYEEGTWTASITGGTFSSLSTGRYTKIGRQVFAYISPTTTAISGNLEISGLPFTSATRSPMIVATNPPAGITYIPTFVDTTVIYVNVSGTYSGGPLSTYFACVYEV